MMRTARDEELREISQSLEEISRHIFILLPIIVLGLFLNGLLGQCNLTNYGCI